MSGKEIIEKITEPLGLGEGPHWDATRQLLYFVDVYKSEVHSYNPKTRKHSKATVGSAPVTLIIPVANKPQHFLISYGGSLHMIKWDGESQTVSDKQPYLTLEDSFPTVRMNDGKASPSGVLFAGSMGEKVGPDNHVPPGMGTFYMVDTRRKPKQATTLIKNIGISNGLAWNKEETVMYWAETLDRRVFKFDYDRSKLTLSNKTVFVDYADKGIQGKPDGMTIDTDGNLWIACVEGGHKIIKVDPNTGAILREISFGDVSDVTSVAFGGPTCEDLYVTSIQKDGQKNSGCLFKVTNLGAKGFPGVPVPV